ncbi:MAG TPA: bacillithiol biosynthesis BshC [Gemmatimonas sp.]|uniref:bacillithiol biosynthesis protein BshC n=1 Tax=Gemmatimonas sp. TaxID=1962908 RepID=UPI002EDA2B9E
MDKSASVLVGTTEDVIIRTAPLGGSALSRAIQQGAVGASWYAPRPKDVAGWRAHADGVRASFKGRDWLAALRPAFAADGLTVGGAAGDRLGRAARDGVLVTTGQQPGLFGGPTYTWSKAMSALAMADVLEAELGIPVAPVFWAATDDADWIEAAVTYLATSTGLERVALTGPATDGVAMADVLMGDLDGALAQFARACGSGAHASVLDVIHSAYTQHATIGAAYVVLMRALLEPLGMAVLDAAHPATRTAADPFLRTALQHAPAVLHALQSRSLAITAAGHDPQVDIVDGLSLVFRTDSDKARTRVPVSEAADAARSAPVGSLGANVLLRPVLERALLPTVCYLAGPGEFAYFAQVSPVAEALGAAAPVVAPRWAAEVLEAESIERQVHLGLSDDHLRDPHAAEQVVARAQLDDTVADAVERLRVTMESQLASLGESLRVPEGDVEDDAVVAASVVQGLERDITHLLDRFERRLLAGVKRREHTAMREVASVRAALRPLGQPPERVLNLVPLLVRYGPSLLDRLRDAAMGHAHALVTGASGHS